MDDNTSGQGERAFVPPEIRRWNWGAFLLNWIWGIGNDTYIALLTMIPLVDIVMPFVLGAKGSEWAWRNKRWRDVAHFKRVQRNWAIAGVAVFGGFFALFALSFILFIWFFGHSESYRTAVAELNANPVAISETRHADHDRLSHGQHFDHQGHGTRPALFLGERAEGGRHRLCRRDDSVRALGGQPPAARDQGARSPDRPRQPADRERPADVSKLN